MEFLQRIVEERIQKAQEEGAFDNLPGSIGHIKSGKLRALGITDATRIKALPDVPAIAETLPGYEATVWYGIAVPRGTPPEIVAKLEKTALDILAKPDVRQKLTQAGFDVTARDGKGHMARVTKEVAQFKDIIAKAGIKQIGG